MFKLPVDSLLAVPGLCFLFWFSVACFGVGVSMTFHHMCAHIIFCSSSVAELPPFGKELLTLLTICSLCILTISYIIYFPFWV